MKKQKHTELISIRVSPKVKEAFQKGEVDHDLLRQTLEKFVGITKCPTCGQELKKKA